MSIIYSGINAKVKAMSKNLLKPDDYLMLSQYRTVDEAAHKLGELSSYESVVSELGETELHRSVIEQRILFSLIRDFFKIYTFIGDFGVRNYLDALFIQYEVEIIKVLLCSVYDDRDIIYSVEELSRLLGKKSSVDVAKLMGSKNVEEFINNLQGTVFYNVLSKKYEEESPSLFEMEMELNIFYYTNIWNAQYKYLDKKHQKTMEYINGTEIDMCNIQWIYRLKTYYKINDSKIYAYLTPIRYKLSQAQIAAMIEAANKKDLLDAINDTPYKKSFSEENSVDLSFFQTMYKVYKKALLDNPNSLAGVSAYLFMKKMEIKNAVSLLECIRYGLSNNETLEHLFLPAQ